MAQRLVRAKRKIALAGHPVPAARGRGAGRADRRGAARRLPRLQRGVRRERGARRRWSAPTCARRRCGSRRCSRGCCPTTPRSPGCAALLAPARRPPSRPGRRRRAAGPAGRAGPRAVGLGADRARRRAGRAGAADRTGRAVPAAGRDRRAARGGPSTQSTDWPQIVALYGLLEHGGARTHGAAQPGRRGGDARRSARRGWTSWTGWTAAGELVGHHRLPSARAHLLEPAGAHDGGAAAYDEALALAGNAPERAYLRQQRERLAP